VRILSVEIRKTLEIGQCLSQGGGEKGKAQLRQTAQQTLVTNASFSKQTRVRLVDHYVECTCVVDTVSAGRDATRNGLSEKGTSIGWDMLAQVSFKIVTLYDWT